MPKHHRKTSRTKAGHSVLPKFLHRYPRWAWWLGAMVVVVLYIWAFYYFFVGPTGFRWRALYGDVNYPDGYEIRGIDISHYQGEIDWEKLRHAMIKDCPVRFVFIKSTEGASILDDTFNDNFYQAREYGFYAWSLPFLEYEEYGSRTGILLPETGTSGGRRSAARSGCGKHT